ncbi:hypothetical protein AVM02_02430 [Brucella anthropi]|uniref:hypothetical protein n=1 Tax=Brucella anthropi TaxID=529 RepID=UPI003985ACC8
MPQFYIQDGGLGSLFAKAVSGGGSLRDKADAYRIRQAMDLAEAESQREAIKNKAEVAKLQAEAQGLTSKNALLTSQMGAADTLGGAYGDFFKDAYVKNHMTPGNTTYGPQQPDMVRREAIPDSTAALLAAQGRTAALAMPGADPEKVAQAQRMMLGNNEMLFGTDPERIRIGASAALGTLPDSDTVLSTSDRDAVLQNKIAIEQAKEAAKAKAEGSDGAGSPFGGNSEYATSARIISNTLAKHRRGEPITPDEVTNYQIAYNKIYGPETRVQIDPQDQRQYIIQTTPQVPQSIQGFDPNVGIAPSPDALLSPRPAPVTPAPVSAPSVTSPVPATGEGQTTMVPGTNATVTSIGGTPKPLTEAQGRDISFASTMNMANDQINNLIDQNGGLPPLSPMQMELMRGSIGSSENRGYFDTMLQTAANAGASAETQKYVAAVENFINPVLRKDSGAAVPASEYPKYFARFIPVYGDRPEVIAEKKLYREAYLGALNQSIQNIMQAKGITNANELAAQANTDPALASQLRAAQENAFSSAVPGNAAPTSVAEPSDEELLRKYGG